MNPSTASSVASLGNIGRWAVAPLLYIEVLHLYRWYTHTRADIQACGHNDMITYRHADLQTHRHAQRGIQTCRHTDIQTHRHSHMQTYTI